VRKPRLSKAQAKVLAWAIHRAHGFMYVLHWADVLVISDATVAAMERGGWIKDVKYYDGARKWRWTWFYVTDAAKSELLVIEEIARLKSFDDARAVESITADDAALNEIGHEGE
jgi:hypothetical protein